MPRRNQFLALGLLLLPGGSTLAQRPTSLQDIQRNPALEQQVRSRMSRQTGFLQLRAKMKLADARRALMVRLAEAPDGSGAWTMAFEEVTRQFGFLTGPQADLLSFYVLADIANALESDLDGKDQLANLDEEKAQRLRRYMDKRSEFMTVLSNVLKRTADIEQQLTRSIQ